MSHTACGHAQIRSISSPAARGNATGAHRKFAVGQPCETPELRSLVAMTAPRDIRHWQLHVPSPLVLTRWGCRLDLGRHSSLSRRAAHDFMPINRMSHSFAKLQLPIGAHRKFVRMQNQAVKSPARSRTSRACVTPVMTSPNMPDHLRILRGLCTMQLLALICDSGCDLIRCREVALPRRCPHALFGHAITCLSQARARGQQNLSLRSQRWQPLAKPALGCKALLFSSDRPLTASIWKPWHQGDPADDRLVAIHPTFMLRWKNLMG